MLLEKARRSVKKEPHHRGASQGSAPAGIDVYNAAFAIEKPTGRPCPLIKV